MRKGFGLVLRLILQSVLRTTFFKKIMETIAKLCPIFWIILLKDSPPLQISTVIKSKDAVRFHIAYCSLLKGNMDGLKKMKKVKPKVKAT